MAEHINGQDLLGSGGHVWRWGPANPVRKSVATAGVKGEYSCVTAIRARPGRITGRRNGQAVLKATGSDKDEVDAALNAIEAALESLCESGLEVTWQDDHGHSGTALQLHRYQPLRRVYNAGCKVGWQFYTLTFAELNGGW